MTALRAIEEWTGHQQPPNPMKATFFVLLSIIALLFVLGLSSCAEQTVTAPDGTVTHSKTPDSATIGTVAGVILAYAPPPKAAVVRKEKAGPIRRHLQGWQDRTEVAAGTDRITRKEIDERRK